MTSLHVIQARFFKTISGFGWDSGSAPSDPESSLRIGPDVCELIGMGRSCPHHRCRTSSPFQFSAAGFAIPFGSLVVVECIAAGAFKSIMDPQLSIMKPQQIQTKLVKNIEFLQISKGNQIRFGTRLSTENSFLRISELQPGVWGIWGSMRILEVQFRLRPAISRFRPTRNFLNLFPLAFQRERSTLWVCTRGSLASHRFRQAPWDCLRIEKNSGTYPFIGP
jgi:hypothetical protein